MMLLIGFAFLAGIVTILSPCILPVLPIILSSSVDTSGKRRPLGVVTGFVVSFTFFTLFLSTIVKVSGIPAESLRHISVVVLILFGLSLFVPKIQLFLEKLTGSLARFAPSGQRKHGFGGGFIIGLSLGLLWTPCVGPILASVISLAISGTVSAQAFIITLAYSLGTAIPMFIIMQTGSVVLGKVPWLVRNTGKIQKAFGVLMVLTALGIFFNFDRRFQTYIITTFPNYGVGLTKFEEVSSVKTELDKINKNPSDSSMIGKPSSDMIIPKGPVAPELIQGGEWFNSEPLTLAGLRGRVVIIDFWTYSCINCQRTLPYLVRWYETYKDKGLVIIGVHAPEFEFEKNPNNVISAMKDFGITYPVMQDNNFTTWRAYDNHYWPAKYIIDKDGVVRYTHFGEGAYDETEKKIQELLSETGTVVESGMISNPEYGNYAGTPEIYLGYGRIDHFVSPEMIVKNTISTYSSPSTLSLSTFAYKGKWVLMEEYAAPSKGSELILQFDAKEVFLVARPKTVTSSMKVYIDDKQEFFGEDNEDGTVTIQADRLYKLINLPVPGKHTLKLQFQDDNTEVFAFTFG